MVKYKLYYFDARGKAEIIRQMFYYGGIDYEDIRIPQEEWWGKLKLSKAPFRKIPLLEVDGKLIAQSGAIYRLIAKTVGLYGKDDMECAEIDMILDTSDEVYQFTAMNIMIVTDPEKRAAGKKKFAEDVLPPIWDGLEKYLKKTDGFFVGGRMTVADVRMANDIQYVKDLDIGVNMEKYPSLRALEEKVTSHPKIAEWNAKRPVTEF